MPLLILGSRLEFEPQGWDLRLEFELGGWDLSFEARFLALRLGLRLEGMDGRGGEGEISPMFESIGHWSLRGSRAKFEPRSCDLSHGAKI